MKSVSINNVTVVNVKGNAYRIHYYFMNINDN